MFNLPRSTALRVLVAAVVFLMCPWASAADAQGFVKGKQEALVALLKKPATPATQTKIESVFDEMLDYDALAEASLGAHWAGLSVAEREDFQGVLKQLVRNSYRKNLKKTLSYEVTFSGQTSAKEAVLVKSVARNRTVKREEPVKVDYVLHQVKGAWRVKDIVTEGSSLVQNYRQQFNRIIKKNSFAELIRRMKAKQEEA